MYGTSHLFFFGDLNFRLAIPPSHPLATQSLTELAEATYDEVGRQTLKEYDQLHLERDVKGSIFVGLREGEFWKFQCSYKYQLGAVNKYDFKRAPAWTDRIMHTTYSDSPETPQESNITNLLYTTIPSYTTSDHVCLSPRFYESPLTDPIPLHPETDRLFPPSPSTRPFFQVRI